MSTQLPDTARRVVTQELQDASEERGERARDRRRSESRESPPFEPGDRAAKRQKTQGPDVSQFAWTSVDAGLERALRPELRETLRLLRKYAADIELAISSLVNSAGAPEFPDSEWRNILSGTMIDLDLVFSGETVQTLGDWVLAWHKTTDAVVYAFPHRRTELDAYQTHICKLFAVVAPSFHRRILNYDRAVRKRVGSVRNVLLSDVDSFNDLRIQFINSCGASASAGVTDEDKATRASPSHGHGGRRRRRGTCRR